VAVAAAVVAAIQMLAEPAVEARPWCLEPAPGPEAADVAAHSAIFEE